MPDTTPSIITLIATLVPTLISGWLSAVVTIHLNAKRSNREKFWELRRAAYGSILAELAAVKAILATADEYIAEGEYKYFDSTVSITHKEVIAEHMKVVRKSYTDNFIICSDEFIELFEGFLLELERSDPNDDPSENHERFCLIVRAALPRLLQQGRREMPVPRSLWHSVRRVWA